MKFQRGTAFTDPPFRYWEAKIGSILIFLSRRHSHIMWGEKPWGMFFNEHPDPQYWSAETLRWHQTT